MKKSSEVAEKKKIKELEEKLKVEHEAKLRLAADLHNLEKRLKNEHDQLIHRANRDLLEKLFPVFDNFSRASQHAPSVTLEDLPTLSEEDFKKIFNYFTGLKMIEKQMEEVLAESGLKRIPTIGTHFDPKQHEAISYEENSEVPVDTVIAEIESGWMIDNWVIKPAKVRVSKG